MLRISIIKFFITNLIVSVLIPLIVSLFPFLHFGKDGGLLVITIILILYVIFLNLVVQKSSYLLNLILGFLICIFSLYLTIMILKFLSPFKAINSMSDVLYQSLQCFIFLTICYFLILLKKKYI